MYIINSGKCKMTYFDVQVDLGLIVMIYFTSCIKSVERAEKYLFGHIE